MLGVAGIGLLVGVGEGWGFWLLTPCSCVGVSPHRFTPANRLNSKTSCLPNELAERARAGARTRCARHRRRRQWVPVSRTRPAGARTRCARHRRRRQWAPVSRTRPEGCSSQMAQTIHFLLVIDFLPLPPPLPLPSQATRTTPCEQHFNCFKVKTSNTTCVASSDDRI